MLGRQTSGSTVCRNCGGLVSVNAADCLQCGARHPALFGYAKFFRDLGADLGFVYVVMGATVLLYLIGLLLTGLPEAMSLENGGILGFLSPDTKTAILMGCSGAYPVLGQHHWWTIFSAGWLHGSLLHIVFNLMWIRNLATPVARFYGPGRLAIVYVLASAVGFLFTVFGPRVLPFFNFFMGGGAGLSLGASAAVMGLLGALVRAGQVGSTHLEKTAWTYSAVLFLFGIFGPAGVDNWAHLGGFVGGYLIARILDPRKPERIDHLVIGFFLLLFSLGTVAISVLVGAAAQ